jgi:hypothetical protein
VRPHRVVFGALSSHSNREFIGASHFEPAQCSGCPRIKNIGLMASAGNGTKSRSRDIASKWT